jgi:hypothetical protein
MGGNLTQLMRREISLNANAIFKHKLSVRFFYAHLLCVVTHLKIIIYNSSNDRKKDQGQFN